MHLIFFEEPFTIIIGNISQELTEGRCYRQIDINSAVDCST
jgi:hypothetical protein